MAWITLSAKGLDYPRWQSVGTAGRVNAGGCARDAKEGQEISFQDANGSDWYPYSIEFDAELGRFSVEMWAMSDEHAQQQLESLQANGVVAGRVLSRS